ncbi:hypothetical protein [Winogradskyella sp.]|uniref:hypothetical protein n=1 Tax=Winogradskyella sp. TaxID=1883156 RepID=UPI003BAA8819
MKNILKLGKALSKIEKKEINGGGPLEPFCGCSTNYAVVTEDGHCVFLSSAGTDCFGTVVNGRCCA